MLKKRISKGFRGALASLVSRLTRIHRRAMRVDTVYQAHRALMSKGTRKVVPQVRSRVVTDDWKYLIVLDACRYDAFESVCSFQGTLEKANSQSAWTKEWAIRNFSEGDWSDVVYVSASAWINSADTWIGEMPFQSVEEVWNVEMQSDGVKRTAGVQPKTVRQGAERAIKANPEKRMVIHFQQPHNPMIGEKDIPRSSFEADGTVFDALRKGELTKREVWEAYMSNLEIALEEIKELLPVLDGEIVITSDHGECFGEYNLFEHPGALVPPILEVPWFRIEKEREVNIAELEVGEPSGSEKVEESEREKHLRSLGYLD